MLTLILAILGSVIAIASSILVYLQLDSKKKTNSIIVFLILVGGIQISIYFIQYLNLEIQEKKKQMELERRAAISLWAYTDKHERYLSLLAREDPYMLGYYYFKAGDFSNAKTYLNKSIGDMKYIAPSNYILGVICRLEVEKEESGDLSKGVKFIDQGLGYDSQYSSLYLEKAKQLMLGMRISEGIESLENAIRLNMVHCDSVINREDYWKMFKEEDGFKDILERCKAWTTTINNDKKE